MNPAKATTARSRIIGALLSTRSGIAVQATENRHHLAAIRARQRAMGRLCMGSGPLAHGHELAAERGDPRVLGQSVGVGTDPGLEPLDQRGRRLKGVAAQRRPGQDPTDPPTRRLNRVHAA